MKIVLVLFLIVVFFINFIVQIFVWIIGLPKDFWIAQKTGFMGLLTNSPQQFREIIRMYDLNGLRHNAEYLQKESTRNKVAIMPIEKQTEYADIIAKSIVDNEQNQSSFDYKQLVAQLQSINMAAINATSIGNVAYWAEHSTNEEVVHAAYLALGEIKEYYSRFIKQ